MELGYKITSENNGQVTIGVQNHYFTRIEAKEVYMKSKTSNEVKDDSLLIYIGNNDTSEVQSAISFGVEEGERFALALLNLCHAIKY